MLEILEKIKSNDKFIELKFDQYPFQLKIDDEIKLSSKFDLIIDSLESQDIIIKNESKKYIKKYDDNMITLEYEKQTFNIYRNPVLFQIFYEENTTFKVYEPEQLKNVLLELQQYYYFTINNNCYDSSEIVILKKENKIQNKIIIFPLIATIFNSLCHHINFDDLKKSSLFDIDKEILEPFFLYVEKLEITKNIGYENMKIFNNVIIKKLTFIMNKERENFIIELDNYANIDIQKEPMVIIGNDGVGKTLTLQLYTLIDLKGYKKFYFNLKLFQKCNPRDYFLIELMRGFISRDKIIHEDDFKKYIKSLRAFQDTGLFNIKNIFLALSQIVTHLKYTGKYIIILDQFNLEKINSDDFYHFKNKISNNKYFKLVICCSLNDDKNKKSLFSDYENIELYKFFPEFRNAISEKNISKDNKKINVEEKIEDSGMPIDNFYLIKKRKRDNAEKDEAKTINKKIKVENNQANEKNNIKESKSFIENEIESKIKIISSEKNEPNYLGFIFPTNYKSAEISFSEKKLKIYYSNLISLEDMLRKQMESNDIINCMSEFNFLPKYYYKFHLFKAKKNIENEKNICKIIQSFYDEEIKSIKKNITIFYSKKNLNEFEIIKNNDANIYQYLLKLKKCIAKTYETPIDFPKLYEYSLKFPFKYINIQIDNKATDIKFDETLKYKKFILRYSFPFVEKVIDKMIEEYDNEDKININELSGSAYGNTLELKIRENLNYFNQVIEVRKVWSLDLITDAVKKEKLKEIEKEKKFNKISRFEDLEDIVGIKELKGSFFYFKPENQDNKLFDSIFLIKKIEDFYMIALQITKDREKRRIKTKEEYSKFMDEHIKYKFEKLYGIKISKIYFWYILGNEILENGKLELLKIKYAFYSIKYKCFFKVRNNEKIDNLNQFIVNESQIFPYGKKERDDNIHIITPKPTYIILFENMLFDEFEINNKIFFENIRKKCFCGNFGPKLGDELKKNIIKILNDYIPYTNKFEILFLFSFPSYDILEFQNSKENEELVYLFKIKNKIYILFQDKCFEIDIKNNSLVKCILPEIDQLKIKEKRKFNNNEFDFSSMEDIYKNPLIYLYKIYYLGDKLLSKK